MSLFWFDAHRADRAQPPDLRRSHQVPRPGPGRPRAGRPLHAGRATHDAADRVRGARLPRGLRLEGLPGAPARSAATRCRPGLQQAEKLPEPLFTPATKATDGHDVNIDRSHGRDPRRQRGALRRARAGLDRALQGSRRVRRDPRHHHRRHQVRVRARPTTAGWCWATRCSRPTRPASGRPTPTRSAPRRRRSTSSTCATGSRRSTGTRRRPAPRCRPRWSRAPSAATSRPTRCITGGSFEAYLKGMGVTP